MRRSWVRDSVAKPFSVSCYSTTTDISQPHSNSCVARLPDGASLVSPPIQFPYQPANCHRNPTLEDQALARIHRIGQTREVTTVRFYIRDSFEEVGVLATRQTSVLTGGSKLWMFKSRRSISLGCCSRRTMQGKRMTVWEAYMFVLVKSILHCIC